MAYCTKGDVQNYLNVDISSSFESVVTTWIGAVTRWIDRYCGKTFEAVSETRHYDADGTDRLIVDDFVGTATVSVLDDYGNVDRLLTDTDDFRVYPLNTTTRNELRLMRGGYLSRFGRGNYRLAVTATFGYSTTVPDDIKLVATKLVASIVDKGLKGGKLQSVSLGDYSSTFSAIDEHAEPLGVYNVLDMYRDISI